MTSFADEDYVLPQNKITKKQWIAGSIFMLMALLMGQYVPTIEIAWVSAILILTIYLFAFEVVGVDVAATSIMVLLGLTGLFAPYIGLQKGLVDHQHLFDGFSSNAVISIIAVMIIGAGLDKTGLMTKVAAVILKVGGTTEGRIIPIISGTVGVISSFMQNVGATALFLPVVSRISSRINIPLSRLLMPMGFCAILGGTVTMIGSSPLILLNDLILTTNHTLPESQKIATWSLFSVSPIGLALVSTGIIYFVVAGRFVLPANKTKSASATTTIEYFREVYGINYKLFEATIPENSLLLDKMLDDVEHDHKIRIIAMLRGASDLRIGPGGVARDTRFEANSTLGIFTSETQMEAFSQKYDLSYNRQLKVFSGSLSDNEAGIAEVVIPPASKLIGKSARDVAMRKVYGLALVALHRDGETLREGDGIRDLAIKSGDTLVVHTTWKTLFRIENDRNFVVVTTEYPHEETRQHKVGWALLFFGIALSLVLFTNVLLSIALLTGAIGMVLSGVLRIEEAYESVSWKTVFLLASLIPLGLAVETSGTAKWIADQTLSQIGGMPIWVIQSAIALLATFFTLVMSNVGATVLLVPLAINIAMGVEGANPAVFALTVALATSNSFLLPTHQVNALIMGPGGYRVYDFMKAGSIMTLLFLIILITMMNLIF